MTGTGNTYDLKQINEFIATAFHFNHFFYIYLPVGIYRPETKYDYGRFNLK
jgi:hypothetical protein